MMRSKRWARSHEGRIAGTVGRSLVLLVGLCLACAGGCDRGEEKPPAVDADQEAPPIPVKALSPIDIWKAEAGLETKRYKAIPQASTDTVASLLADALGAKADEVLPAEVTVPLRKDLRTFLNEERLCFEVAHAGSRRAYTKHPWLIKGKCYWTAWLLAEAVRRGPQTAEQRHAVREDVAAFARALAAGAEPGATDLIVAKLLERYDDLGPDAMFPAFKAPLSPADRTVLVKQLSDRYRTSLADLAGGKKAPASDRVDMLVQDTMFELAYRAVRPKMTEYWGHMRWVIYGPGEDLVLIAKPGHALRIPTEPILVPRWPISIAFVPNMELNQARGWKRGGQTRPATRPATPKPPATRPVTTQPSVFEDQWSPAVGGIQGRLTAGLYVARRLASRVTIRLRNTGTTPVKVDGAFAGNLVWRLTDGAGKDMPPAATATIKPAWHTVGPGETVGKVLGRTRWTETGTVELSVGSASWVLFPGTPADTRAGKYTLQATLQVAYDGAPEGAWTGTLPLPPVTIEVFADVRRETLLQRVREVRASHGGRSRAELYMALAELVSPGMTIDDMLLVLPPAVRQKPQIEDHGTYFFIRYPLDLDFDVKAVAVRQGVKQEQTLTSRPRIIERQSLPPSPEPAPATRRPPNTRPAGKAGP